MSKNREEILKNMRQENRERSLKLSEGFSRILAKDYYDNLLTYWEKQLILFTKGHYGTYSNDYLKVLVAKAYALPIETLHSYTILHMMTELHTNLVAAKILHFDLLSFINSSAKRSDLRDAITMDSFINELFAQFQGIKVKSNSYELDLGELDTELYNTIDSLLKENKRKDIN